MIDEYMRMSLEGLIAAVENSEAKDEIRRRFKSLENDNYAMGGIIRDCDLTDDDYCFYSIDVLLTIIRGDAVPKNTIRAQNEIKRRIKEPVSGKSAKRLVDVDILLTALKGLSAVSRFQENVINHIANGTL